MEPESLAKSPRGEPALNCSTALRFPSSGMSEIFLYQVDSADLLITVDAAWLEFAQKNLARDLVRENILGKPIWSFFSGYQVEEVYGSLFRRVRLKQQPIVLPFRCDSPTERRLMELNLSPLVEGGIHLESTMVQVERRKAVPLFDYAVRRSKEFVIVCSWCKKIRVADEWLEVEVAVERLGLFHVPTFPQLSHGICPPCKAEALGR